MIRKSLIALTLALASSGALAGSLTLLRAGKPSAAWTPASLSGLFIWLDASVSGSVIRSGANVSAWNDQSGAGNNFTATNNPQYSATSFPGSKPGITTSNALSNYLRSASVPLNSQTLSCFAVFNMTTATFFPGIISLLGTGAAAGDYNSANSFSYSGGNNVAGTSVDKQPGTTNYSQAQSGSLNVARSGGIVFNSGTGQATSYADFVGSTPANYNTTAFGNTTASVVIGARQGPSISADYFTGAFSEVICATSAITGSDLTSLQLYWQTKWGTP